MNKHQCIVLDDDSQQQHLPQVKLSHQQIKSNAIKSLKIEGTSIPNHILVNQLGLTAKRIHQMKRQFKQTGDIKLNRKPNIKPNSQQSIRQAENQVIINCIKNNRFASARQILRALRNHGYIMCANTLFARLAELGYHFHKDIHMPVTRNTIKIIEERFYFARWIREVPDQNIFYASESRFDMSLETSFGWLNDQEIIDEMSEKYIAERHTFLAVYISVGVNGIVGYKISDERENMATFVSHLSQCLVPLISERDILLMDPNDIHCSRLVQDFLNKQRIPFKFIPQYSPCFNPTYHIINLVKTKICKKIRRGKITDIFSLHEQLGKVISKYQNQSIPQLYDEMRNLCEKAKFRDKL